MAPISINGTTGISGVDGSAGTPALQGSDTNTGIAFGSDVIIGSTGGTERFRCDSGGRMLVGTSTSRSNVYNTTGYDARFQLEGTDGGTTAIGVFRNSNDNGGSRTIYAKSRGTSIGSNTVVQSGDQLGSVSFQGSDGSEFVEGACIECFVDATPGANDMPGRLVFSVTSDGSASPVERGRITCRGFSKFSNAGEYDWTSGDYHEFNNNIANWIVIHRNTNVSPTGINVRYSGAAPNGSGNEFLYCNDTSALRAAIRSNGGLANYSANNANLSDRNAKKDISPAAGTWDCIKEWEIVNYRYKDQPDDADLNLGVIAQQVAESCPEVITVFEEAKDDQPEKLGIKEQQMYWMAIKALQEAQVRIEALEAEVAALKAQ